MSTKTAIFVATKHEKTNVAVISICLIISFILTLSQQYKKSNRGHYILSYIFSLILNKTPKSIWNNFYDVFIQISGKYKKHLTQRDTPACSNKINTIIWFWI